MYRTLRAFAWMRWRLLINSFEKTGSRDTLERFSIAIEKLGPVVAAIVMIPSALALSVVGAAAGYALARAQSTGVPMLFEVARYALLIVIALSIAGPLILRSADRTNPVRLLLLPISRATLYVAHAASAFGDPWILVLLPLMICIPLGLAAGAAFSAALVTLLAGAGLVIGLVGLSALSSSVLHLVMRDRRRGELLTLLFILIAPMLSMVPALLDTNGRHGRHAGAAPVRHERRAPPWVAAAGARAFSLLPSELYITSTRAASRGELVRAGAALSGLALGALCVHGLGMMVFVRILDSPGSSGTRRAAAAREIWGRTLPGLSAGESAVALAQYRLALRTPRGRQILLSPIIMLGFFGVMMLRKGGAMDVGRFGLGNGLVLGAAGAFLSLLSLLQIAVNQFAIDRAGLTLAFLSPLTDREYLDGKAAGNALIAFSSALVCIVGAFLLRPGGSLAMWLSIPAALIGTYLLVSPVAALLSALFPRAVDLNSIGRRSNAHGLAGLLGTLSFVASGAPPLVITIATTRVFDQPSLLLPLLLVWLAIAYGLNRALFVPVRAVFARRRENLAMLSETKSG